jgi:predicted short-subunit dehydrogenase-like oxidoreductase (DUF2520 family)
MMFDAKKMTARQVQAFERSRARLGLALPTRRGDCAVVTNRRGAVDMIVCNEGDGYYFNRPLSIGEKARRRMEAQLERRRRQARR